MNSCGDDDDDDDAAADDAVSCTITWTSNGPAGPVCMEYSGLAGDELTGAETNCTATEFDASGAVFVETACAAANKLTGSCAIAESDDEGPAKTVYFYESSTAAEAEEVCTSTSEGFGGTWSAE